jgi:TatA/E family protein of Tat protein translocase
LELAVIGLLALLLFGSQLPKLARNAGKGIKEFKEGLKDVHQEITSSPPPAGNPPPAGQTPAPPGNGPTDSSSPS